MKAKDRILAAAVYLARRDKWKNLTRDRVAKEAGCAAGLVNAYYSTMDELSSEVMRVAAERGIESILLEGIGADHPVALESYMAVLVKR